MGLTWEREGLGIRPDTGHYPPLFLWALLLPTLSPGNHPTSGNRENKAGLNQPLSPLGCLGSCMRPVSMKRGVAGPARALGPLIASGFLKKTHKQQKQGFIRNQMNSQISGGLCAPAALPEAAGHQGSEHRGSGCANK